MLLKHPHVTIPYKTNYVHINFRILLCLLHMHWFWLFLSNWPIKWLSILIKPHICVDNEIGSNIEKSHRCVKLDLMYFSIIPCWAVGQTQTFWHRWVETNSFGSNVILTIHGTPAFSSKLRIIYKLEMTILIDTIECNCNLVFPV